MRMLTCIAAFGLLAIGGCSQTSYGYRPQTAALPDSGFENLTSASYVPRYGNPAISSSVQDRLYAHPE